MRSPTPVKASGFIRLPKELQKIAIQNGIYPVNDIFYPVIQDESKIQLLYGGYGSGKSVFKIDNLIDECLAGGYFRFFYGRKVFDTNRGSTFSTFTDRIEERFLQHRFTYSKADNSSMVIKCDTGGVFIPFGADNIDKLKSTKDASGILCEELDQFSLADFGVLISRLRTTKVKTKFIGLFNTTTVKKDHWIKGVFFPDASNNKLKELQNQGIDFSEYTVTKLFCNYTDNYFLNKKEYEQTMWFAAAFNSQKFKEIADGLWGADQKDSPFCYTFDEKKHVKKTEINPAWEVIASFDFNVDPITCYIGQHNGNVIRGIEQIKLENSNIYLLCDYIKVKYGKYLLLVTGDATGRARSALVKDNLNYFKIIKAQLNLGDRQMRQPISNPPLDENRVLVNAAFHWLDIELDPVLCEALIFDLEHVNVMPDGSIEKQDRNDPKKRQDALACFRYYLNTFFKHILKFN